MAEISELSFEAALAELEKIVNGLERGDTALDKSIEDYERGEALKKHCEKLLQSAEVRVDKIRVTRDGKPDGTEPLDPQ